MGGALGPQIVAQFPVAVLGLLLSMGSRLLKVEGEGELAGGQQEDQGQRHCLQMQFAHNVAKILLAFDYIGQL